MPTIRKAAEKDIPRILELLGELVISTSPSETGRVPTSTDYKRVFAQIKARPGQQLLVAEEDKILGTMELIIVPNLSHGGLPWPVEPASAPASGRLRLTPCWASSRLMSPGWAPVPFPVS